MGNAFRRERAIRRGCVPRYLGPSREKPPSQGARPSCLRVTAGFYITSPSDMFSIAAPMPCATHAIGSLCFRCLGVASIFPFFLLFFIISFARSFSRDQADPSGFAAAPRRERAILNRATALARGKLLHSARNFAQQQFPQNCSGTYVNCANNERKLHLKQKRFRQRYSFSFLFFSLSPSFSVSRYFPVGRRNGNSGETGRGNLGGYGGGTKRKPFKKLREPLDCLFNCAYPSPVYVDMHRLSRRNVSLCRLE